MTAIAELLQSPASIDVNPVTNTLDAVVVRELEGIKDQMGDFDLGNDFVEKDEVQSIATYQGTVSGGTFTLTFTIDGVSFTTAAITFDANAAAIESAIDTAASGVVAGWTNGDISITGGPLTTTPVTVTFDGASVSGKNHPQLTADGGLLTGGGSMGAVSTPTEGQSKRVALGVLYALGAVSGTVPAQGDDPSGLTAPSNRESNSMLPSQYTLKALAREAGIVDQNKTLETELLEAMGL